MIYDVAVIGAGVIGGMIARELMKYELSVCLLEAEDDIAMGASRANSGIVHAGFDAVPGSLKAKLNVQGSAMMEEVTRELGVRYQRNGSLVVGFGEQDKKTLQILYERGNQNGVAGLRLISGKELHDMEPNITVDTVGALYAPTGAIVCPYGLTIAAVGNAMDNGTELYTDFLVKEIVAGNDAADGSANQTEFAGKEEFFVLSSEYRSLRARYIVNAAGLYADTIARMAGDTSFTIHPRKGEYLLLDAVVSGSFCGAARFPSKIHECVGRLALFLPAHLLTKLRADLFALVFGFQLMARVEIRTVCLVFQNPVTGEGAILYLTQNLFHFFFGFLGDDAFPNSVISVFCGVADRVTHQRKTALH